MATLETQVAEAVRRAPDDVVEQAYRDLVGPTGDEVAGRLLDSAARLSFDPDEEIDWDADLDPNQYGLNPEWSSLFGTPLWDEMSEQQRITLTRHEVASIMSTGIWFEMILQQMLLREKYAQDPADNDFRFALTEIADECRHSLMFAKAIAKLGAPHYSPSPTSLKLGRLYKTVARSEAAYGAGLVAEEVLDVMQRDWMRGDNVLDIIRGTSRIHVVEESRHMTFARQEMRDAMADISPLRRRRSGTLIAIVAHVIVTSLVDPRVYAAAGLDTDRAVREAAQSAHRRAMMRASSAHLMRFLDEAGLLSSNAVRIYRRLHML